MTRKTAYIGSLAIGAAAFVVAKTMFPHDGIGGEYLLLGLPYFTLMLELAMLGREDDDCW